MSNFWLSVEKHPPPYDQLVLVAYKSEFDDRWNYHQAQWVKVTDYSDWCSAEEFENGAWPTHWAPLPPTPDEEANA